MKRIFLVLATAVMVLPWLTAARVQADMIQWSVSASAVVANGSGTVISNSYPGVSGSNVTIELSNYGNYGLPTTGTNAETVPVVALNAGYIGNLGSIDSEFGGPSSQYQLNLTLRDQASGASGSVTFNGYFSGVLGISGGGNTLTNNFVGPTTQSLKLGSDLYTVTIGPTVLPQTFIGASGWSNGGSISASISVQPATSATPEPSSLLLACLGLPPLGLARWLRRKSVANHA
ncbi:MAG TPA: hypothetical protein VMG10_14130 [Gemmataceae bacterium]|nr:hypothetical protein [Gemmataceae bacterium]